MEKILTVMDCSGSFAENGKIEILRTLRLIVGRVVKNFRAETNFFIWRENIRPLISPKDIVAHGVGEISALEKFLADCPVGAKILLLSDGLWDIDARPKIKSLLTAREIDLAFVAVGADSNNSSNYDISTVGGIWSPAEIPAAIQRLLFGGAS